jgi:pseudolysin
MRKTLISHSLLMGLSVIGMNAAWSATPVDLQHQPVSFLKTLSLMPQAALKQTSSSVDFNQTSHIRMQQTYNGYKVWGADAVAHIPASNQTTSLQNLSNTQQAQGSLNGMIYQDLASDLASTPSYVFTPAQADKAQQHAIQAYGQAHGIKNNSHDASSELMVFVDKNNKAHWAFLVNFDVDAQQGLPAKPHYLMDAVTFDIFQQWDNIQTEGTSLGGGFGGNQKMGKLVYDGLKDDYSTLDMTRDEATKKCLLQNPEVIVKDRRSGDSTINFKCDAVDAEHNNVYWDADMDAVNGGYSPSNDALYAGKVIKEMYTKWYDLPVLTKNGKPMLLVMRVHEKMDNAYWDGKSMTFGDGISMFYPLTSLGVSAHEVSHGFTEQHSGLVYSGQSGGLNESFSDMAAQAAEYYSVGKNTWQIGPEIFKQKDQALRYMDKPSKDCQGRQPGNWCSIDTFKDYNDSLDVHYSSGVFNRAFYLIAKAKGWDTKKAFDVMVKANVNYWTSSTSFKDAACGVLSATKDYKYNIAGVKKAMKTVGLDISKC